MTRQRCIAPRGSAAGLTLIELMVAMAVFAALGLMSYRALDSMSAAQVHLDTASQRWRELARAMQRIEFGLRAVLSAPPEAGRPVMGQEVGNPSGVWFLRTDPQWGVSRQVIQREPSGELVLLQWPGREPMGQARRQVLLTRVTDLRWVFWFKGQAQSSWPVAGSPPGQPPDAVGLELALDDWGTVQRLWLLRW